jgi:hypothetical protein
MDDRSNDHRSSTARRAAGRRRGRAYYVTGQTLLVDGGMFYNRPAEYRRPATGRRRISGPGRFARAGGVRTHLPQ